MTHSANSSYFARCQEEPFRIFFPLATLLGVSGVSLWPLFFSGLHKFYPGQMHARLMIEGFLAGFVLGFLGTALPRLLSAPPLRRVEFWILLSLFVLTAGLHIGEQPRLGDLAFIVLMLSFGACMAPRVLSRADAPPPGFVLVGLGYFSTLLGPACWLTGLQGWTSGHVALFGAALLNQGFPTMMILGAGAFLIPRLLRLSDGCGNAGEEMTPSQWRRRAVLSAITGLALIASYWLEADTVAAPPTAVALRAFAILLYLAIVIPFHRQSWPPRTMQVCAQLALLALAAGVLFPFAWPVQRLAGLHVIFLGGFSLITFTVATRVVLGHSGNEALFQARLPSLQITTLLLLAGAVLRAVGDFLPSRSHLLTGASHAWMLGAAIWGFAILPKCFRGRIPSRRDDGN